MFVFWVNFVEVALYFADLLGLLLLWPGLLWVVLRLFVGFELLVMVCC